MKKLLLLAVTIITAITFTACQRDADVVSHNLSKQADSFEINRRVVFYNGITGDYILSMTGLCSIGNYDRYVKVSITCKTGEDMYKKHYLGLSDNVTFFVEQIEANKANKYHYEIVFKPQSIIPDIDFQGSTKSLIDVVTPDNKD